MSNHLGRREFIGSVVAGLLSRPFLASTSPPYPTEHAKVHLAFHAPLSMPNALAASPEGLWVVDHTDVAFLVDWKDGSILRILSTGSSNTSGATFGGGFLWLGVNGKALGRPPRKTDWDSGRILKVDPITGKTISHWPLPNGGGTHGLEWVNGRLWVTDFVRMQLSQVDPTSFQVLHSIPLTLPRAHGLAWDNGALWCIHTSDRVINKMDARTGRILRQLIISKNDPEPHGMTLYQGNLYYSDSGIAGHGVSNESPGAGSICRIENTWKSPHPDST